MIRAAVLTLAVLSDPVVVFLAGVEFREYAVLVVRALPPRCYRGSAAGQSVGLPASTSRGDVPRAAPLCRLEHDLGAPLGHRVALHDPLPRGGG